MYASEASHGRMCVTEKQSRKRHNSQFMRVYEALLLVFLPLRLKCYIHQNPHISNRLRSVVPGNKHTRVHVARFPYRLTLISQLQKQFHSKQHTAIMVVNGSQWLIRYKIATLRSTLLMYFIGRVCYNMHIVTVSTILLNLLRRAQFGTHLCQ